MQYDNRYLYEGGNPYLRPEYILNVELSGVYKWLSVSGGYNTVTNPSALVSYYTTVRI